jgi:hypothetical protein
LKTVLQILTIFVWIWSRTFCPAIYITNFYASALTIYTKECNKEAIFTAKDHVPGLTEYGWIRICSIGKNGKFRKCVCLTGLKNDYMSGHLCPMLEIPPNLCLLSRV